MNELDVIPSIADHCANLAPNLRQSDVDEIRASHGILDPLTALEHAMLSSDECFSILDGDDTVAMFGVCDESFLSERGVVWMLARDMRPHARQLLSRAPEYIARLTEGYESVYNYVDARNDQAIRFLSRMGFDIHPPEPHGLAGLPFHKFDMRCTACVLSN